MGEECLELKNIKYQTMLLGIGNSKLVSAQENTLNIDAILDKERQENRKKPWNKLSKATKLKKLDIYSEVFLEKCALKNHRDELKQYLLACLDRKKLNRVKDVIYDKTLGQIKSIPNLVFCTPRNKFTLKRSDKRNSTLKGLPPRRRRRKGRYKIKVKDKQKIDISS